MKSLSSTILVAALLLSTVAAVASDRSLNTTTTTTTIPVAANNATANVTVSAGQKNQTQTQLSREARYDVLLAGMSPDKLDEKNEFFEQMLREPWLDQDGILQRGPKPASTTNDKVVLAKRADAASAQGDKATTMPADAQVIEMTEEEFADWQKSMSSGDAGTEALSRAMPQSSRKAGPRDIHHVVKADADIDVDIFGGQHQGNVFGDEALAERHPEHLRVDLDSQRLKHLAARIRFDNQGKQPQLIKPNGGKFDSVEMHALDGDEYEAAKQLGFDRGDVIARIVIDRTGDEPLVKPEAVPAKLTQETTTGSTLAQLVSMTEEDAGKDRPVKPVVQNVTASGASAVSEQSVKQNATTYAQANTTVSQNTTQVLAAVQQVQYPATPVPAPAPAPVHAPAPAPVVAYPAQTSTYYQQQYYQGMVYPQQFDSSAFPGRRPYGHQQRPAVPAKPVVKQEETVEEEEVKEEEVEEEEVEQEEEEVEEEEAAPVTGEEIEEETEEEAAVPEKVHEIVKEKITAKPVKTHTKKEYSAYGDDSTSYGKSTKSAYGDDSSAYSGKTHKSSNSKKIKDHKRAEIEKYAYSSPSDYDTPSAYGGDTDKKSAYGHDDETSAYDRKSHGSPSRRHRRHGRHPSRRGHRHSVHKFRGHERMHGRRRHHTTKHVTRHSRRSHRRHTRRGGKKHTRHGKKHSRSAYGKSSY